MRGLFAALLVVGCYAPHPHPGEPCTDGLCPAGLVCSQATQTCETSDVDAAIIADAPSVDVPPSAFAYRRRISIKNVATATLPSGFTIRVPLGPTLGALIAEGKLKPDLSDLRIIGDTGEGERDRIVDPTSGPAPVAASFSLAAPIAHGDTNLAYAMYYGAPTAGPPPTNGTVVFTIYDQFSNGIGAFWLKNDGPVATGGQLVLRAGHTDALTTNAATDNLPIVSAIELVATIQDPTSEPTTQPEGTFYYWFGYQHTGDFSASDPWATWIARGKGSVQGEQKSPVGCEMGCEQPVPSAQDTAPHYYAIERDPTVTRFYLDGTMAYMTTVTNSADYSVMVRNYMATSGIKIDYVRARARVTPDPVVTLGPEETL